MKSYPTLPQGYVPFATIDLVHNKKQFWIVNGLSAALCVIMLILPFLWGRSLRGFVGEGSLSALLLRLGVVAGLLAYIALHELTHGAVMKACGASVRYGYKVAYAYAGSDAYFTRPPMLPLRWRRWWCGGSSLPCWPPACRRNGSRRCGCGSL